MTRAEDLAMLAVSEGVCLQEIQCKFKQLGAAIKQLGAEIILTREDRKKAFQRLCVRALVSAERRKLSLKRSVRLRLQQETTEVEVGNDNDSQCLEWSFRCDQV